MAIPKIIYQTYRSKKLPLVTRFFIWRMKKINPNFEYQFFDDHDIERFIKTECSSEIFKAYQRITIGAAKADFFRYLILHERGGVYLDIDSTVTRNLETMITDHDSAIISKERNPGMYVQWALVYEAKHPFLAKTIEKVLENINNNSFPNDVHKMTGPSVYSEAIRECLDKNDGISYREFGTDYNGYFKFKHPFNKLLYLDSEHWKKTQLKQTVLRLD